MLRGYDRRIVDAINALPRSNAVHPGARLHLRAAPDGNRGQTRRACGRRIEVFVPAPDSPELRSHDRLLAPAAADLFVVGHRDRRCVTACSSSTSPCGDSSSGPRRPDSSRSLASRSSCWVACCWAWESSANTWAAYSSRRVVRPRYVIAEVIGDDLTSRVDVRGCASGFVTTAVVFGYGDVGVRCTQVLLNQGVDVKLVVTHEDDPAENRWYASLAEFATAHGLPVITPTAAGRQVAVPSPRAGAGLPLLFLLPAASARRRCSRRRVAAHSTCTVRCCPVFEVAPRSTGPCCAARRETGATLHYMVARADAGDIVDQEAVPILENDTAHDVFVRVAECRGHHSLAQPAGTHRRAPPREHPRTSREANTAAGGGRRTAASTGRSPRAKSTTWSAPSRRRFPEPSPMSKANAGSSRARVCCRARHRRDRT